MTNTRKKMLFGGVMMLLMLLLTEGALQVVALISTKADLLLGLPPAPALPDARLGWRPNPRLPEHDANGYRNPAVPDRSTAVALGDSQTYGVGVAAGEDWPRQLSLLWSKSVYNMAYSGWGPVHSLLLWPEAMKLQPKVVLAGFYAGNDLFDAYQMAHTRTDELGLGTTDPGVREKILAAEKVEALTNRVDRMAELGMGTSAPALEEKKPFSLRALFSNHSKLYGLIRAARRVANPNRTLPPPTTEQAWSQSLTFAAAQPQYRIAYTNGPFRTVFLPEYRLTALNLEDPRIAEGLHVSLRALERMHAQAGSNGTRFVAVLIPTKEMTFALQAGEQGKSFAALIANETEMWRRTKAHLEQKGIAYVDLLPAFRELLPEGRQPYQVTFDGHPNALGHQAIARAVLARLQESASNAPPRKGP